MIIRHPSVAGSFYPVDKKELLADLQSYLDKVAQGEYREPVGFVVPHAGYIYSGLTAAHAYRIIRNRVFDTVTVLAPSHFDAFNGLCIYSGDALATPLGEVEVSAKDRDRLLEYDGVVASEVGFGQEHSLEVQLPFLQHVLKPGWKIIPIVMGYQNRETVELAARIIGDFLTPSHLSIISSDLSHYHPYDEAKRIDERFCSLVREWKLDDLWDAHLTGEVEACGFGPVYSFLKTLNGRSDVVTEILDYRNSGDTAGPRDQVVGYCSIGVFWSD